MSAIMEPVLIVVLGGVVGAFIITMYLPIFKIAGAVLAGNIKLLLSLRSPIHTRLEDKL